MELIPNYEAIIMRSGTSLNKSVLEKSDKLKIIARAGIGLDNIDIEVATKKGIQVINAPASNAISTAEHTFALMLSLARKIVFAHQSVINGQWQKNIFRGVQLQGKTLGIIGLGRIGTQVAIRGNAFGMKVIGYDPYISDKHAESTGALMTSFDSVCRDSDIITIHTPLNDETKGLISNRELNLMKKSALLINCARGGICVEKDVAEKLALGDIAGAAFDVLEKEPPEKGNLLLTAPNFIITPHLGAATDDAQNSVAIVICESLIDFFTKGLVVNGVNSPDHI